jgi:hypothetical protein
MGVGALVMASFSSAAARTVVPREWSLGRMTRVILRRGVASAAVSAPEGDRPLQSNTPRYLQNPARIAAATELSPITATCNSTRGSPTGALGETVSFAGGGASW